MRGYLPFIFRKGRMMPATIHLTIPDYARPRKQLILAIGVGYFGYRRKVFWL